MDQQVKDRLDGIEAKLDSIVEKFAAFEEMAAAFLNGPGKTLLKMFGGKG